jgi:hypothetical protein
MITLDEFSDRIDRTLAARTRGELGAVVADLPDMDLMRLGSPMPAVAEQLRGWITSVERRGQWTVPPRLALKTRMCDATLDFSNATLQSATVLLELDDYFGTTNLILPDRATADLNGVETFGGSTTVKVPHGPTSDRLHLVVRGRVRFGSVTARYPLGTALRRMFS